jgi:hypothetical protein
MKVIFDKTLGIGQFNSKQMEDCLRALVARAGLNFNEIVGAYTKRRTKFANDLLHIHLDGKYNTWMCGSNPHFTAAIVDENGKPIVNPHI